ncbi:MAG: cadherin-like domain-containing protein, partial [Nitrosomonas sp.]|nr:cadherin-like domain-containing protein [Nitrosomonas sp.]
MKNLSTSQRNSKNQEESGSFIRGFSRTPQATDDLFITAQTETNDAVDLTEDSHNTFLLDVMANDLGGNAKSLWSLDDARDFGRNGLDDLMIHDAIGSINTSAMGADISITADGMVSYTYTPDMQTELQSLSEGEFALDTFIYSIQLGNGTHSWATATVKIAGVNDAPELTGTVAHLEAGTEGTPYTIHASDLLAGFTD